MGFFTYYRVEVDRVVSLGSQSLSGWDGVFHHNVQNIGPHGHVGHVAIPFRVGWGFSLTFNEEADLTRFLVAIPFRVGWGFSPELPRPTIGLLRSPRRNPFQGGMGFFTIQFPTYGWGWLSTRSQSLSGWDGVFHSSSGSRLVRGKRIESQSLSGWDGIFHPRRPMMGSWSWASRNPFQGGMGFFTA